MRQPLDDHSADFGRKLPEGDRGALAKPIAMTQSGAQ